MVSVIVIVCCLLVAPLCELSCGSSKGSSAKPCVAEGSASHSCAACEGVQLLDASAEQISRKIEQFSPQDATWAIWAFARLFHYPDQQFLAVRSSASQPPHLPRLCFWHLMACDNSRATTMTCHNDT